jgi:hypothetical protein
MFFFFFCWPLNQTLRFGCLADLQIELLGQIAVTSVCTSFFASFLFLFFKLGKNLFYQLSCLWIVPVCLIIEIFIFTS